jgi:hypothetical protein
MTTLLRRLRRLLYPVSRLVFIRMTLVEGALKGSGLRLRMLIVGEGWGTSEALRAFEETTLDRLYHRRALIIWACYTLLARRMAFDLAVANFPPLYDWVGGWFGDYAGLCTLHWRIDTRRTWPEILGNMKMETRRQMRRLDEDKSLSFREAGTAAQLHAFHHDMYLPLMRQQHGERAVMSTYELHQRIFRDGMLVYLEKAGVPVAAVLASQHADSLVLSDFGIAGGSPDIRKDGGLRALYYIGLQKSLELKLASLDLKYTASWLSSGLVQHKASLGARVSYDAWLGHLCLRFGSDRAKAFAFLEANPLAIDRRGRLHVLTADHGGDPKSLERKIARWKTWGFDAVEVLEWQPLERTRGEPAVDAGSAPRIH